MGGVCSAISNAFSGNKTTSNTSNNTSNNDNDSTPTFNSLTEASAAGYHGQAVNIAGKGLQKVEFADDNYNKAMADVSSAAITTSSNNNNNNNNTSGVGAGNQFDDGTTSLGSVSATGQYAGDGFEWQQNPNTNALTRVYTGANEDAGLGTEVFVAGT